MQEKKVFNKLGFSLFVMVIAVNLVQVLMIFGASLINPELVSKAAFNYAALGVSFYVVGFVLYFLMTKNIPDSSKGERRQLSIKQVLMFYLICMGTTYIFNYLSVALNLLIGLIKGSPVINPLAEMLDFKSILLTVLFVGILSPIIEEIVFRGIMLSKVRKFGDKTAIVFTAVAFGLFHGNFSQFFYAVALGMIFAYITVRTNTIKYSIILHILINLTGSVILPQLALSGNLALTGAAGILILVFIVSGIVLFCLNKKKIVLEEGEVILPRSERMRIVYGTPGMLCYIAAAVVMFIMVILS